MHKPLQSTEFAFRVFYTQSLHRDEKKNSYVVIYVVPWMWNLMMLHNRWYCFILDIDKCAGRRARSSSTWRSTKHVAPLFQNPSCCFCWFSHLLHTSYYHLSHYSFSNHFQTGAEMMWDLRRRALPPKRPPKVTASVCPMDTASLVHPNAQRQSTVWHRDIRRTLLDQGPSGAASSIFHQMLQGALNAARYPYFVATSLHLALRERLTLKPRSCIYL